MIRTLIASMFGEGRNVPAELIETFRVNAEAHAARGGEFDAAALQQFAAEFRNPRRSRFASFVDGLNRLPRPLITLGLGFLLALPLIDVALAVEVFTAWAIIPPAVWALIGIVVTFFFGGRMQASNIQFQRDFAGAAAELPAVLQQLREIRAMSDATPGVAGTGQDAAATIEVVQPDPNPALSAWRNNTRAQEAAS